jgi:DNA-binding NarL/FixJ family response regulator
VTNVRATEPLSRPRTEPLVAVVSGPGLSQRVEVVLADDGLSIVAVVSSAADLADACGQRIPHVTIVAWEPGGPAALRIVVATMPRTRPIVLLRRNVAGEVRDALRAGADGVVLEDDVALSLPLVVRSVALGQASAPRERRIDLRRLALSEREGDVVALVSRGLRTATIAERLSLAPSTVKRHLSSAYAKVGVSSREELLDVVFDDLDVDSPSGPVRNGES